MKCFVGAASTIGPIGANSAPCWDHCEQHVMTGLNLKSYSGGLFKINFIFFYTTRIILDIITPFFLCNGFSASCKFVLMYIY